MKAGRELDKLIAEKIFYHNVICNKRGGWSLGEPDFYDSYGDLILSNPLPAYSQDIAAAWQVVEKLRNTNRVFCLASVVEHMGKKSALMWVAKWEMHDPDYRMEFAISADAPTAICLASLKAIG